MEALSTPVFHPMACDWFQQQDGSCESGTCIIRFALPTLLQGTRVKSGSAFAPDSVHLASGTDGTVRLWSIWSATADYSVPECHAIFPTTNGFNMWVKAFLQCPAPALAPGVGLQGTKISESQ
jgi:hypothetical protein